MKRVNNAQDLGKAIKNGDETIEIEGDLGRKVVRIKATGKTSFIIAAGAVAVAVIAVIGMVPAAGAGPAGIVVPGAIATTTAAGAVAIWGFPVTVAAISIGVAARNKNAIKILYNDYTIVEKKANSIVVRRK